MTQITRPHVPDIPDLSGNEQAYLRQALQRIEALRAAGIEPYPHGFDRTHLPRDLAEQFVDLDRGEERPETVVKTEGRIKSLRNKKRFIELEDYSGQTIQVKVDLENLNEEQQLVLDSISRGDIIGVEGFMMRTAPENQERPGELSVVTDKLTVLSISVRQKPKKPIEDPKRAVRNRVDTLILDSSAREKLRQRFKINETIRSRLNNLDWLEVETPVLETVAGGTEARPFETHHNALDMDMQLRIATEIALKKMIIAGVHHSIYEIGRLFRNEGVSLKHNPEFTSIELYSTNPKFRDYNGMMNLTEDLIRHSGENIDLDLSQIEYWEKGDITRPVTLDLSQDFKRRPILELIEEHTGVDFSTMDVAQAQAAAQVLGVQIVKTVDAKDQVGGTEVTDIPLDSWGKIVMAVFEEQVEDQLIQPTFVTDYPAEVCPLTKQHRDNPRLAERFELFIAGMEIANSYTELTDPIYQRKQFELQAANRDKGDEEAHQTDETFMRAIEHGMPPCGGLGIGLDRLAMLLTQSRTIREVIAFPTVKPKQWI